jgi:DNA uptake protein ComE-like DNA-binding protein
MALGLMGVGLPLAANWPDGDARLDCPPDRVRFVRTRDGESIAQCSEAAVHPSELPVLAALTLGQKPDLNEISEADLGTLPGIGKRLAKTLVATRSDKGPFKTWADVDAVEGVGVATLENLRNLLRVEPE